MRYSFLIAAVMGACVETPSQAQAQAQAQIQAQVQPRAEAKPAACQRVCTAAQARRLGVLATDIVVCDAANENKCKVKVEVTVGADGKCVSRLPYCVLCIVTGTPSSGKPKFMPRLEWSIDGSGRYRFEAGGVEIKNASGPGKEHFKNPGRSALARKYTWETSNDPSPTGEHAHQAYVFDWFGLETCTPIDPFIVNTEN